MEAGADAYVYVPPDGSSDGPPDSSVGPLDVGPVTFLDVPFLCAGAMCSPSTHYCLHVLPDGGLTPDAGDLSDRCLPIPAACAGNATCSCLESVAPCEGEAGVEGEGCIEGAGVEVTCP
jgi:hypothetical protein